MIHSFMSNFTIDRALVVVDPKELSGEQSEKSDLFQRALDLVDATGCELELFTAYYEPTLELSLFAGQEEVSREKDRLASSAATRLGEFALELRNQGAKVSYDVRWDRPYADALLRKISETDPDLVLKLTHGPSYVLGLDNNPDWELIRKSPSHLWFVKQGVSDIKTVLTAIGGTDVAEGIISQSDYKVFEVGNKLAESMGAKSIPAHTYEVPKLHAYAAYEPVVAASANIAGEADAWEQIARAHGEAITNFAKQFEIDVEQVKILKGHAADVIPALAKSLDAGLVVMGARNLGRWERLLHSVAAEPVLSMAPCDIVFVKEARGAKIPEAYEQPRRGVPSVDIEKAITQPDKTFESPQAVVENDDLTVNLRHRILDAWELDVNAQLKMLDEGGPVQDAPASLLREINIAKESLARVNR